MSEDRFPSAQEIAEESLSTDDLAILQAFDALDTWQGSNAPVSAQNHDAEFSDEDMRLLFAAEVDEDIGQMKHALSQLEQGDTLDMTRFTVLLRVAHKIRGSAGAMECHALAAIARHIEDVVAQINAGALLALVGLNVLVQAVLALEVTLQDFLTHGQESNVQLLALEQELAQFGISAVPTINAVGTPFMASAPTVSGDISVPHAFTETTGDKAHEDAINEVPTNASIMPNRDEATMNRSLQITDMQGDTLIPSRIHIEAQRFGRLLRQAGQLAETHTPLENAQEQVDIALRELYAAQEQLQQLEHSLVNLALPQRSVRHMPIFPASSLVERMLKEAAPHSKYAHTLKQRPHLLNVDEKTEWDELEFDRDNERARAVQAIRDAIARVTVTYARVQSAYNHLRDVTQRYVQRATDVHTLLNLLRLTPINAVFPYLQRMLKQEAPNVLFETAGETTEVDQDILDMLASPLAALLHTCVTDTSIIQEQQRAWLHANALGNEVTLEIGFSMTVQGGALAMVQPAIQQLGGSVDLQRNSAGGVSFFLHFPRSQGALRGLLVRVGDQRVVIPFSQVQHVSDEQHEKLDIVYHLYKLLEFPYEPDAHRRVTPIIVLPQGHSRLLAGIRVDEVVSDVNVIVKPLPHYLLRPGIAGTALDGKGQILLLLDIPALLKHYTMVQRHTLVGEKHAVKVQKTQPLALIADDSMLLRRSLAQTLARAHYDTLEACDGLEALDSLTQNPPDVFLLDMEMPNLNGYDLLGIMHIYPELNDVKVIILTSRAIDKYKQRAMELGAHAYLTKPCPSDVLLETIAGLLG